MVIAWRLSATTALVVAVFAGCGSPSRPGITGQTPAVALSAPDVAAIRAAVAADADAVRRGDWDAVARLFTEDAVRFPPNQPPLRGRPAIRAWLDGVPRFEAFRITADEIVGTGDAAFVRGRYELRVDTPTPMNDRGHYLGFMRKQQDGSWLWASDMIASELPAPDALPANTP